MKHSTGKTETRPRPSQLGGRSGNRLSAGAKIVSAIEEATEILRSEGLESKRLTIRTYKVPKAVSVCRPGDVRRVRQLLGTSQAVLAGFLGVNVNTVRSWEQGKRLPQPIACRFLSEIESDPIYWRRRIGQGDVELHPGNQPDE
jgi:putative transcriptional regulator